MANGRKRQGKPDERAKICPKFHAAVELVGRRWTGAIIRILLDGPARFGELKDSIPELSDRLLSERLKELEDSDLVEREVTDSRPPLVSYSLTPRGRALEPALEELGRWAARWITV